MADATHRMRAELPVDDRTATTEHCVSLVLSAAHERLQQRCNLGMIIDLLEGKFGAYDVRGLHALLSHEYENVKEQLGAMGAAPPTFVAALATLVQPAQVATLVAVEAASDDDTPALTVQSQVAEELEEQPPSSVAVEQGAAARFSSSLHGAANGAANVLSKPAPRHRQTPAPRPRQQKTVGASHGRGHGSMKSASSMSADEAIAQAEREGLAFVTSSNSTGYYCVNFDSRPKTTYPYIAHGFEPGGHGKASFLGSFATAEEAALAYARHTGNTVAREAKCGRTGNALAAESHSRLLVCQTPSCDALVDLSSATRLAHGNGRITYAQGDGCTCCSNGGGYTRSSLKVKQRQIKFADALLDGTKTLVEWPSSCARVRHGGEPLAKLSDEATKAAAAAAKAFVADANLSRKRPAGACGAPERGARASSRSKRVKARATDSSDVEYVSE